MNTFAFGRYTFLGIFDLVIRTPPCPSSVESLLEEGVHNEEMIAVGKFDQLSQYLFPFWNHY